MILPWGALRPTGLTTIKMLRAATISGRYGPPQKSALQCYQACGYPPAQPPVGVRRYSPLLIVLAARTLSQIQQQILKARRSGKAYDAEASNVMKERLKVSKFMNGTMDQVPSETQLVLYHYTHTCKRRSLAGRWPLG